MRKRLSALAVIGAMLVTPAFADDALPKKDWYLIDFSTGKCVQAAKVPSPRPHTPDQMHKMLRAGGVVDAIQVLKDPRGNLMGVSVAVNDSGSDVTVLWFVNSDYCGIARDALVSSGAIPNDEDLK